MIFLKEIEREREKKTTKHSKCQNYNEPIEWNSLSRDVHLLVYDSFWYRVIIELKWTWAIMHCSNGVVTQQWKGARVHNTTKKSINQINQIDNEKAIDECHSMCFILFTGFIYLRAVLCAKWMTQQKVI